MSQTIIGAPLEALTPMQLFHNRVTGLLDQCYAYWPKLEFTCNYRTKEIIVTNSANIELGRVSTEVGPFMMYMRMHINNYRHKLNEQLAELEQK